MKNAITNCSLAISLAALIGFCSSVLAQQSTEKGQATGYPSKPVRIITGSAGGSTDAIARGIALNLGERFKSPVIVEAKNNLAVGFVAKAGPDGHTFLLTSSGTVMNAALLAEQRYDPLTALAPVTQLTEQSYILVVHPSLPVRTVKEFIALAKSKPGALSFSTSGAGSEGHIGMELFKHMAGIDMVAIPYKGSAGSTADLVAGRVQATLLGSLAAVPLAKAGKIRVLGGGGLRRIKVLPDVPTISESGLPGFEATGWYGFFAPAGTPSAVTDLVNREIREILTLPLLTDRIVGGGGEVVGNSPAEFKSAIEKELATWRKVIAVANIQLN